MSAASGAVKTETFCFDIFLYKVCHIALMVIESFNSLIRQCMPNKKELKKKLIRVKITRYFGIYSQYKSVMRFVLCDVFVENVFMG